MCLSIGFRNRSFVFYVLVVYVFRGLVSIDVKGGGVIVFSLFFIIIIFNEDMCLYILEMIVGS